MRFNPQEIRLNIRKLRKTQTFTLSGETSDGHLQSDIMLLAILDDITKNVKNGNNG